MPTRRVTVMPASVSDMLNEYEKLLSNRGYAAWQLEKVFQEIEVEDLTEHETVWLSVLVKTMRDPTFAPKYIFADLKDVSLEHGLSKEQFTSFFMRLLQKRPAYTNQVLDLFQ